MDYLDIVDPSWKDILKNSFEALDSEYLEYINSSNDFFPNRENFLSAFKTLSKENTKYILFGQDPYPRYESAIGYAFIDGKVESIWSDGGLSKEVNRATSLRNFIKMLLLADNKLSDDFSKGAVAKVDKSNYIDSIHDLKNNFEKNGVLLLNMALIFEAKDKSKFHTKMWKPFIKSFLDQLDDVELILFGNIAKEADKLNSDRLKSHYLEHPYNVSFITNPKSVALFKDMRLLDK
jgi:uracil-DNA glycosylase